MPERKPRRSVERHSVFLNIPYDSAFENLYLPYIAGLSAFGLVRRAVTNELQLALLKFNQVDSIRVTHHLTLISQTGPEPQGLVNAFRAFT